MRSAALKSVLFIFSLFLIVGLLPPVQLYGSTTLCDPSFNLTNLTNCDEESPSSSTSDTETTDNLQSDNTETPLIIPDISPTSKDLDDAMTDGDLGTTDTDATDDVSDDDNSENQDVDSDSSNSEGGSSDNEPSLIPFP
jgi:hypothetical protein